MPSANRRNTTNLSGLACRNLDRPSAAVRRFPVLQPRKICMYPPSSRCSFQISRALNPSAGSFAANVSIRSIYSFSSERIWERGVHIGRWFIPAGGLCDLSFGGSQRLAAVVLAGFGTLLTASATDRFAYFGLKGLLNDQPCGGVDQWDVSVR